VELDDLPDPITPNADPAEDEPSNDPAGCAHDDDDPDPHPDGDSRSPLRPRREEDETVVVTRLDPARQPGGDSERAGRTRSQDEPGGSHGEPPRRGADATP
jgi:hypothetical protein